MTRPPRSRDAIAADLIEAIEQAETKPKSLQQLADLLDHGPRGDVEPLELFKWIDTLLTTGPEGTLTAKEAHDLAHVIALYREYKAAIGLTSGKDKDPSPRRR